jgi:hypothetical protein
VYGSVSGRIQQDLYDQDHRRRRRTDKNGAAATTRIKNSRVVVNGPTYFGVIEGGRKEGNPIKPNNSDKYNIYPPLIFFWEPHTSNHTYFDTMENST